MRDFSKPSTLKAILRMAFKQCGSRRSRQLLLPTQPPMCRTNHISLPPFFCPFVSACLAILPVSCSRHDTSDDRVQRKGIADKGFAESSIANRNSEWPQSQQNPTTNAVPTQVADDPILGRIP